MARRRVRTACPQGPTRMSPSIREEGPSRVSNRVRCLSESGCWLRDLETEREKVGSSPPARIARVCVRACVHVCVCLGRGEERRGWGRQRQTEREKGGRLEADICSHTNTEGEPVVRERDKSAEMGTQTHARTHSNACTHTRRQVRARAPGGGGGDAREHRGGGGDERHTRARARP